MNSDWLCCLKQKSESIALLKKSEKFKINDYQQKMLESVTSKPGEYSEVMIMTSEHASIGRLILEPFSRVLYSTKPEEYERVKRYEGDGKKLEEARVCVCVVCVCKCKCKCVCVCVCVCV